MSTVRKITLGLGTVILVFLLYVALQPGDYVISRDTVINAPAAKIFPYMNNSKVAESWGPWLEVDKEAKMSYSGPDAGVGSVASWESSGQLDQGFDRASAGCSGCGRSCIELAGDATEFCAAELEPAAVGCRM